ncbi:MAG: hypothetical protein IKJ81_05665 [Bacteroidales bacterium]|nr:hypothetical protein [Bacteroidales bacterium]
MVSYVTLAGYPYGASDAGGAGWRGEDWQTPCAAPPAGGILHLSWP